MPVLALTSTSTADMIAGDDRFFVSFNGVPDLDPHTLRGHVITVDDEPVRVVRVQTGWFWRTGQAFRLLVIPLSSPQAEKVKSMNN